MCRCVWRCGCEGRVRLASVFRDEAADREVAGNQVGDQPQNVDHARTAYFINQNMARLADTTGRTGNPVTTMPYMVEQCRFVDIRIIPDAKPAGIVGHVLHRLDDQGGIAILRGLAELPAAFIKNNAHADFNVERQPIDTHVNRFAQSLAPLGCR